MSEAIRDDLDALRVIAVYHRGTIFYLAPGNATGAVAQFGGNIRQPIHNCPASAKLHQFLKIDAHELGFAGIPLVYGITHDGCNLTYRINDTGQITIEKLYPAQSSSDWPYTHYPGAYSVVDLQMIGQEQATFDDFQDLLAQGYTPLDDEDCTHVAIPPHKNFGVSLWGEDGDLEMVQILFSIDHRNKSVKVENQCT